MINRYLTNPYAVSRENVVKFVICDAIAPQDTAIAVGLMRPQDRSIPFEVTVNSLRPRDT